MTKTIIKEQQELTEFGYMARAREVVTESCKCSYLQQELQKTREQLEIAEKVIFADIGYNVFEFHRLREEYLKTNKENS